MPTAFFVDEFLFYFSSASASSFAGGATGVDSPSEVTAFAEPLSKIGKVSPSLLPMIAVLTSLAVDSVSFDSLRSGDLGFFDSKGVNIINNAAAPKIKPTIYCGTDVKNPSFKITEFL